MSGKIQSKKLQVMWRLTVLLCFFVVCISAPVEAKEYLLDHADPEASESFEQSMIRGNISVAQWFNGVADGLDLFLAGERYTKKPNETSVTLESSGFYNEADGASGAINFNVDLRLPNVEEYWQLTFTSYDEMEDRSAKTRYLRQTPRERNIGASVGLFKKLGEVKTSFRPRIAFEGTPAISHSLKFESVAERRNYRINPELEFYATPSKGAGLFQSLNFNWELTKMYSVTLINEGDYQSRPHIYTVTNGVSLGQQFNKRMSLAYNTFVTSINRPNYQLDAYNFSVTWHHVVYKKILEYRVIPNLDFTQKRNFAMNPGVNVSIDINF